MRDEQAARGISSHGSRLDSNLAPWSAHPPDEVSRGEQHTCPTARRFSEQEKEVA